MFLSDDEIAEMEPAELARLLTEKGKLHARDVTLVAGNALCEHDPKPFTVHVSGHGSFVYRDADIRDPEALKTSLIKANCAVEPDQMPS